MTATYKYLQNNSNDQTLSVSAQHPPVGYVGHVFCSDQQHLTRHTSATQRTSQKNIYQLIDQLAVQTPKCKTIRKVKIASWNKNQIAKFKQLLRVYGTDFQAISTVLGKTRDQVKRKFKVLQKKSSQVTQCVFSQKLISQKDFQEQNQFC